MPQEHRAEIKAWFRTPSMNVVGFYELLHYPEPNKVDPVKAMQYRAYMVGSGVKMAEMVLQHDDVLSEVYSHRRPQLDDLKRQADEICLLATMLDGENSDQFADKLLGFALASIRFFD